MENAELLFSPGCKAGSAYCTECGKNKGVDCPFPPGTSAKEAEFYFCENGRSLLCLDAEAQLNEIRDKVERLEAVEGKIIAMRNEVWEYYSICIENMDEEGAAHFGAVSETLTKVLLELL